MENKNRLINFLSRLTAGCLVSLFAFPILLPKLVNVLFVLFAALVVASSLYKKPKGIWSIIKSNMLIAIPFIPYITEFLFHYDNRAVGFELEKKLLFFIAPVIIGLYMLINRLKDIRVYMYAFTGSLFVLTLYTLISLCSNHILFSPESYENASRELRQSFEGFSHLHPTYYSLFATIAILWLIYDYRNQTNLFKWIYVFTGSSIFLQEVIVAARMPLIALVLSACILMYKLVVNKKKLLYIYAIFTAFIIVLPFAMPSLKSRLDFMIKMDINDPRYLTRVNEREVIFDCSKSILMNNIWLGIGNRNAQPALDACYATKNFKKALTQPFNAHNQFLSLGINYGVFIMLLFIISIIYFIKKTRGNYFAMVFMVSTVLVMLTESVLERQWGVYFYVLFFLVLLNKQEEDKVIEADKIS